VRHLACMLSSPMRRQAGRSGPWCRPRRLYPRRCTVYPVSLLLISARVPFQLANCKSVKSHSMARGYCSICTLYTVHDCAHPHTTIPVS